MTNVSITTAPPPLAPVGNSFASPEMLETTASLFPNTAWRNTRGGWSSAAHFCTGDFAHRQSVEHQGVNGVGGCRRSIRELGVERLEGGWPSLIVGPGMVRYTVTDTNRAERSDEKHTQTRINSVFWGQSEEKIETASRGKVTGWSAKSRNQLRRKVGSLDLAEFASSGRMGMVTLTLPGDWESVTPTSGEASALWRRFERRWFRQWGRLRCIWKREFQRRGAPHWHLWVQLPEVDEREFQDWLSVVWSSCMRINGAPLYEIAPAEFLLSVAAGTRVDVTSTSRADSTTKIISYFLKESIAGEGKAYQNWPPKLWRGQSVGRFWGVLGIEVATVEICLDPRYSRELWRAMRRWRVAATRAVTVVRYVDRIDRASGTVRRRKQLRRVSVRSSAGFLLVDNGAYFAGNLARYARLLESQLEPRAARPRMSLRSSETFPARA